MPTANNQIKFVPCVKSAYDNLLVKDDDTIYFITDEYKIYVGSHEYTKSLEILQAEPTTSTAGTTGKLYYYSNSPSLYIVHPTSGNLYTWTKVANLTNCSGDVTGSATSFVKSVSMNGETLSGTVQAADTDIQNGYAGIPTSLAVRNYVDFVLRHAITCRISNGMAGTTLDVKFIPSQEYLIKNTWSSIWNYDNTQTGMGTAIYTLNGTQIAAKSVAQGNITFNIMPYLSPSATHTVTVKIRDAEGNETSPITYTIATTAEIPVWTVNFYKDSTIVQTSYVENGQDVVWLNLVSMLKDGYYWEGWDTSLKNITQDTDIHGVYSQYNLPATPVDVSQYDYIYTNDPNYTSAYTFGEFLAANLTDDFEDYISIGNKMRLLLPDNNLHTHAMEFVAADFKHFKVAGSDPAVYANVVWDYRNAFTSPDGYQMNTSATNVGGFKESKMFKQNLDAILALLPEFISNNIGPIEYKCFNYLDDDYQAHGDTVSHKLYVAGGIEMGVIGASAFPYTFEIDSGSRNVAFPYYTTNALRQKKQYVGAGNAREYWLRTALSQSSASFWAVGTSGTGHNYNANSFLQRWLRLLLLQNLISLNFCSNLRGASPRIRAVVNAEPARCEPPINQMTNY